MKRKVTVSDHALVRYLDRVGGFDIEGLRNQLAKRLQPAADAGARGVVIDGHSFLIDHSEGGPAVVTVLPVTKSPRNLMGGQAMSWWPFGDLTPLRYGAILADPPWAYQMRSAKGYEKSPEAHYQTMTVEDIAALPVDQLAGPDCYLFMWSTWPHLPDALWVMQEWGFSYVTGGSWTKRTRNWAVNMGTGYVLRSATEPFLVGKIGRPRPASRSVRNLILATEDIADSIESVRREHSRKPPEMRQLIEELVPDLPRCELFGREPWAGAEVWGNQADLFEAAHD